MNSGLDLPPSGLVVMRSKRCSIMTRIRKAKLVQVTPWLGAARSFHGVRIALASAGRKGDTPCPLRWASGRAMELSVYRSGHGLVGVVSYRTDWDDEYPARRITVLDGPVVWSGKHEDIVGWLGAFQGKDFASLLPREASKKDLKEERSEVHVAWLWQMVRDAVTDALKPETELELAQGPKQP